MFLMFCLVATGFVTAFTVPYSEGRWLSVCNHCNRLSAFAVLLVNGNRRNLLCRERHCL